MAVTRKHRMGFREKKDQEALHPLQGVPAAEVVRFAICVQLAPTNFFTLHKPANHVKTNHSMPTTLA